MENRGKRQAASIFGGMGFYIALLVCVAAAGVVGYFALLNPSDTNYIDSTVPAPQQQDPVDITPVIAPEEEEAREVVNDHPLPVEQSASEEAESEISPTVGRQDIVLVNADTPPVAPPPAARVVSPLEGETVAVFSVSRLLYDETLGDWRTHDGIDIQAETGAEVAAAAAGTVISVSQDPMLGTTVVIDHENGYVTTYASLQEGVSVLAGDSVEAGTVIGLAGCTALNETGLGNHLHFSVTKDGVPVDPEEYLK